MKLVRVTVVTVHDQLVAVNLGCFDEFDTFLVLFSCRCVLLTFFDEVLHLVGLLDVLKGAGLRD